MPVEHVIFKVGSSPERLPVGSLESEHQLEEMIVAKPEILSRDWMLIGQQVKTSYGGKIDLLAITPDAGLVVIELKRDRTPREVVAQALDYASWVEELDAERISEIYRVFKGEGDLAKDFQQQFKAALEEDNLNQSHQIVIVATELDDSTERIIRYLEDKDVSINVLFFQVFENTGEKLLSRAWLVDPVRAQANAASSAGSQEHRQPWNGEYYVSLGGYTPDLWEAAREYGFICGGGGTWYSNTLKLLSEGDRVWVNIPPKRYAGVGIVTSQREPVTDFKVESGGRPQLVRDALPKAVATELSHDDHDPERMEYFVGVKWLDTRAESEAIWETGFFGIQHTVCRPKAKSWWHTVERLKTYFQWQSG